MRRLAFLIAALIAGSTVSAHAGVATGTMHVSVTVVAPGTPVPGEPQSPPLQKLHDVNAKDGGDETLPLYPVQAPQGYFAYPDVDSHSPAKPASP